MGADRTSELARVRSRGGETSTFDSCIMQRWKITIGGAVAAALCVACVLFVMSSNEADGTSVLQEVHGGSFPGAPTSDLQVNSAAAPAKSAAKSAAKVAVKASAKAAKKQAKTAAKDAEKAKATTKV